MAKKNSTFGSSFKRELGKNTGRFVSNKVFGDGHASKHKIIHDGKIARANAAESKAAATEMKAEAEYERQQQETLREKQSMINQIRFGSDVDEITHALDELLIIYKSDDDDDIKSAARAKAKTGIIKLNSLGEIDLAKHYKKQLPNPALRNLGIGLGLFLFLIIMAVLAQIGVLG